MNHSSGRTTCMWHFVPQGHYGVCPNCGAEAIYGRDLDRYFHLDGSNNRHCWAVISRGDKWLG